MAPENSSTAMTAGDASESDSNVATSTGEAKGEDVSTNQREHQGVTDTTALLIPRRQFQLLLAEISDSINSDINWEVDAMNCVQQLTEEYVVKVISSWNLAAHHADRKMIQKEDIKYIRRAFDIGVNHYAGGNQRGQAGKD